MDLETKLKNLPKALFAIPLAASIYAASPKVYAGDAEAATMPQATYEELSPTRQNIKALEDAGWTVYDTEEEIQKLGRHKAEYLRRDDFDVRIDSYPDEFKEFRKLDSLLTQLTDNNLGNDELRLVVKPYDGSNQYAQIVTQNGSIGKTAKSGYQFYIAIPPSGTF